MKLKSLLGLAGLVVLFSVFAGCGSEGYESGIDPNKNPNYDPSKQAAPTKDGKGGFVPDFAADK